jgi:multidrug efflux pump subunit AcrA (membrane-fusion protein)
MNIKFFKGIAAAAAALIMSGCYFFPAEEELLEPPTVAVEDVAYSTYTARLKTIENKTLASGYVTSKNEYEASFTESGGTLKKIYVTAGQFVEEGELLAELDTGNLEYLYEQQKLIVQKAALTASSSTSAQLDYEMEQNTLAEYERQLSNARLYAGISGQVCYTMSLNPGSTVTAYKTIVKIVDPDNLFVKYTSNSMKSFPLGGDVTITVDGEDYSGYVSKTPTESIEGLYDDYPLLAADTSSIYCEFTDGIPDFLTIGELADIAAVKEVHENAVVISKNLIKTDGDRKYVTILDENENKKEVDVTVGIENATEAEILTGLSEGDKVVVR